MDGGGMDGRQLNRLLLEWIGAWDPFGLGKDAYDVEAASVLQAVYETEDARTLAARIQSIYEFAFDEPIPFPDCLKLARRLLELKQAASCPLP
ncbi:apc36109 [Geobacillus kaustophilus GBlys]|uniref:Apc36109 n=5 Tax=Geobacillus TaxID=129337 RepID=U2X2G3_GEOKU|nr:apc36109 [Geobacillus kaustophilus GBlys]